MSASASIAEDLFNEIPECEAGPGLSFRVVDDPGLMQISEQRPDNCECANMVLLDIPEARRLLDWLTRALPK